MRIHRPSHATVVSYLALLTALGGSAFAATRDQTGGKEIAPFIVRETRVPSGPDGSAQASVICKASEQFISGAGFWFTENGGTEGPSISGGTIGGRNPRRQPRSYTVRGHTPLGPNTLVAQAVCLPN